MTREAGALELEQAKDKLAEARNALDDREGTKALRLAEQAELDAQLAQAKARRQSAEKAADELQASIEQLRREALTRSSDAGSQTGSYQPDRK